MLVTNVTRLTDRTTKLYAYDVAEAILSAMEFYQAQEDAFERNYLHHREMAEIGHLTEGLIDEETLQEVLHRIHSPLPASYFYQHAKTHLLRMTSSKICYIISIPIIDAEVYSAWKIATVPFLTQSGRGLAVIMPEASSVAVAHVSGSVIDTSTCIYEDPVLCWNPIRYTTMPCVQGIISKNPDLLDSCLLQATNNHLPTLKKLTVRQILVTTMGERIEERCMGRPVHTTVLEEGTYLLSSEDSCTLAGANGWSYTIGSSDEDTRVITEEFLLRGLNTTLRLPPTVAIPIVNWTSFLQYKDKMNVLKTRKELREKMEGVSINEDLTRVRSKLLYDARKLKNEKKVLDAWPFDGRIAIKDLARYIPSEPSKIFSPLSRTHNLSN
ncbi:hypothetical protein CAPTEDRAFT_187647 [Capitella teleta]|uniref:Uncharacterized protein n=1 Tax=Capitella teleta TaxID=283909 RepID=R7TFN7_CAPTE|nr:hypothetical protein CAPTEDRAFT_187647 [Capitella teleta]|eukprot:ELT90336.1 hypothetical protein CAPTEDRAFT_187647 [Capitella teleta]